MKGKRKFIVTMTYLILMFVIAIMGIKDPEVTMTGNDIQSMMFWIMIGTGILGGTMAIENLSENGGLKSLLGKKKDDGEKIK